MLLRRDANEQRMKAWVESMPKAKVKYFDVPFGQQYFQLQILATHPKFQRQGAGSALCAWGLRISQLTGLAVCVFASPMGRLLYSHLGFTKLGHVGIGAQGEREHIVVAAMVYFPRTASVTTKALSEPCPELTSVASIEALGADRGQTCRTASWAMPCALSLHPDPPPSGKIGNMA